MFENVYKRNKNIINLLGILIPLFGIVTLYTNLFNIEFFIAEPIKEFFSNFKILFIVYDYSYAPYVPINYPVLDTYVFDSIKENILEDIETYGEPAIAYYQFLDNFLNETLSKYFGEDFDEKAAFIKEFNEHIQRIVNHPEKGDYFSIDFNDPLLTTAPFVDTSAPGGDVLAAERGLLRQLERICTDTNPRLYRNHYFQDVMASKTPYILDRDIGGDGFIYIVELLKDHTIYTAVKNLFVFEIINSYCNVYSLWYSRLLGNYLLDLSHLKAFTMEISYLIMVFLLLIRNTIKAKYRSHFWASSYRTTINSACALFLFMVIFYNVQECYYIFLKAADFIFYSNAYLYFYETIIIDYYSTFIKGLLIFLGFCNLVMSLNYIKHDFFEEWEYAILVLFSIFGLVCLISSFNFLLFFICLEFIAITSYFLTALRKYDPLGSEAGIKYFIQGAMASFFLSFGIALIYGFFGTLAFTEIKHEVMTLYYVYQDTPHASYINTLLIAGIVSLTITFLFKISSAPFHFWTPDVYEGSTLVVTSFFAITVKLGIFTAFLRIFFYLFKHFSEYMQPVLVIGAVCSMLIGSIGGLYQRKVKRLFAYSTITHVGYILMGLSSFNFLGLKASLVYVVIYCFTMLGVFAYLALARNYFSWERVLYINDLRYFGVQRYNIYFTATLTVLVFSLAGIPPLAGFYAKWYVFEAIMDTALWPMAFVGIFSSLVSCYYYLHFIKVMVFEEVSWAFVIYHFNQMDRLLLSSATVFSIIFPVIGSYFMTFMNDLTFTLLYPFKIGICENIGHYEYLTWQEFRELAVTFTKFETLWFKQVDYLCIVREMVDDYVEQLGSASDSYAQKLGTALSSIHYTPEELETIKKAAEAEQFHWYKKSKS